MESLVQGAGPSCGCTRASPGSFHTKPFKVWSGDQQQQQSLELARSAASVPSYKIRSAFSQVPERRASVLKYRSTALRHGDADSECNVGTRIFQALWIILMFIRG